MHLDDASIAVTKVAPPPLTGVSPEERAALLGALDDDASVVLGLTLAAKALLAAGKTDEAAWVLAYVARLLEGAKRAG